MTLDKAFALLFRAKWGYFHEGTDPKECTYNQRNAKQLWESALAYQKDQNLAVCAAEADLYGEDSERGLAAEEIAQRIRNS